VRLAAFAALAAVAAFAAAAMPACSLGQGDGWVRGSLNVPDCWSGNFDLNPDFFAAVPYRKSLQLRIQNGGDYETFSDGVQILIDDITVIRPSGTSPGLYGQALTVALPPEVTPPGVPITPTSSPASVHLTLYLGRTCRTQNVALYAVDSVSLNAAGGCDLADGGEPIFACQGSTVGLFDGGTPVTDAGVSTDATVSTDASAPSQEAGAEAGPSQQAGAVGHSSITFQSLFDGDPEEVSAAQRHNVGDFTVYLADPREECPGGLGPPPPCRGYLQGHFDFNFERGKPAQPFP
jgi:hypothetical protein